MADDDTIQHKIIFIGDSGVGKTAIINRLSDNDFNETHITTIGVDFRCKDVDVDGEIVRLQVWDTAGQERFRSITSSYCRGAHGIIIVYAIDDTESFRNIRTWLTEIDKHIGTGSAAGPVVKYLVGNKSDLEDTRCVSEKNGMLEAENYGIKFIETSAKKCINIEELFTKIARDINESFKSAQKDPNSVDLNAKKSKSDGGCC